MKKVQLTPIQKQALEGIQNQKQQINKMFKDLDERESLIVTLVFEGKEDLAKISNIKLEGEFLTYDLVEKPVAEPSGKKEKKAKT